MDLHIITVISYFFYMMTKYLLDISFNSLFYGRYAKDLVNIMFNDNGPDFGAASDGKFVVIWTELNLLMYTTS